MRVAGMNINLPSNWEWAKCSEVIDVRDGTHDTPKYVTSGFPLVTSKNLKSGNIDFSEVSYISEKDHQEISKRSKVDNGDILLAMIGTIGNPVVVNTDREFSIKNVALFKFTESHIDKDYFKHLLNSPLVIRQLDFETRGGTQKFVSLKVLRNLAIPFPPLEGQKRIAAILDKADAIRRKRKEAIALTEELLRSTFLDMFGDPVTNPKGWEVVPMKDVISQIEAGWSAKGEERHRDDDEWGVLKISAVTSGVFKPKEHKAVSSPTFKKDPVIPQKGDLLFSRANTRELVAATCLVEKDCEKVFLPDKLWRIKTNPNVANVEYLRFLLADPRYRSLLARKATGTSGSMLNVSQAKLLDMDAPVPDINTQTKFADVLWRIYKLKERNENSLESLNMNFNSLLQKAFRGEL